MNTGVRSGMLLAVLGLWLIMRATHKDISGRTLIDHILGASSSVTPGQAAVGVQPGQKAVTPAQAQQSAANAINAAGGVQLQAPALDPTVVDGGWTPPGPTGPVRNYNVAPSRGMAQIQAAIDRMSRAGAGMR